MAITAAEHLCAVLSRCGVTHIFTVPGSQNIELLEGARRSSLAVVVPTNECAAGFAAIGAAKSTGMPAVLSTISGPGFALALMAIAEAFHDSVPLIFIAIGSNSYSDGRRGLQEIPQRDMIRGIVKEIISIRRFREIDEGIKHAFSVATSHEPGPVYVELDPALFAEEAEGESLVHAKKGELPQITGSIPEAVERLSRSERTLFIVGGGAASASEGVRILLERVGAYALSTCSGRGTVSEDHHRMLRWDFGSHGAAWANRIVQKASLVVVLGARLGHNGSGGYELAIPSEKMMRVDSSPLAENTGYAASLSIIGDVGAVVAELLARIGTVQSTWGKEIEQLQRTRPDLLVPAIPRVWAGKETISVEDFFSMLMRSYPAESLVSTDSGLHQLLTRAYWRVLRSRTLLVPTDFQAMGAGIPMAIGAALSVVGREVIAIVGDGGFLMTGLELMVARRERLSLTAVVFSDGAYGLIRLQQLKAYGEAASTAVELPDLAQFAESIGAEYFLVSENPEEALSRAAGARGIRIIEVRLTDSEQLRKFASRQKSRRKIRSVLKSTVLWKLVRMVRP